jgi:hypothetical protein
MKKALAFITAAALLCGGCDNVADTKEAGENADTVSLTGLPLADVRLVKTASIRCRVPDVAEGARIISDLAREAGGLVTDRQFEGGETNRRELRQSTDSLLVITAFAPTARLTLRIPAARLEAFVDLLAEESKLVTSSRLSIEDKSLAHLSARLLEENRNRILAPVKPSGVTEATELLRQADSGVGHRIARLETDAEARYSTIGLELFQNPVVRKEMVADASLDGMGLSWSQRMGDAFRTGWNLFADLLVALAHVWVLFPLALMTIVVYRATRKVNA